MLVTWAFFIYLVWMWVIWVFCSSGKSKRTFVSWGVTVCRMWWALELVLSMAWGLGTTQRLPSFDSGWWRWSSSVNCSCQVGCFEFCFISWFFFPSSTHFPTPTPYHPPPTMIWLNGWLGSKNMVLWRWLGSVKCSCQVNCFDFLMLILFYSIFLCSLFNPLRPSPLL